MSKIHLRHHAEPRPWCNTQQMGFYNNPIQVTTDVKQVTCQRCMRLDLAAHKKKEGVTCSVCGSTDSTKYYGTSGLRGEPVRCQKCYSASKAASKRKIYQFAGEV